MSHHQHCTNTCDGIYELGFWCNGDPCKLGTGDGGFQCKCEVKAGAVAGIVMGCVFGFILLVTAIVLCCLWRCAVIRRRQQQSNAPNADYQLQVNQHYQPYNYATPTTTGAATASTVYVYNPQQPTAVVGVAVVQQQPHYYGAPVGNAASTLPYGAPLPPPPPAVGPQQQQPAYNYLPSAGGYYPTTEPTSAAGATSNNNGGGFSYQPNEQPTMPYNQHQHRGGVAYMSGGEESGKGV